MEELNAIVHPAVISRQEQLAGAIGERDRAAVVMVESALIFETRHGGASRDGGKGTGGGWSARFKRIILVRAPEELKVARYVARVAAGADLPRQRIEELEAEARRRLAAQMPDDARAELADFVLTNGGELRELEWQVDQLWPLLVAEAEERARRF